MADQFKRQIAKKVRVSDILGGEFIKQEGNLLSYVKNNGMEISRVNLIATVVSQDEPESAFVDDGSGKVQVRSFENPLPEGIAVGDPVLIIGKVREFNSERYIVPEIIRKINDKRWIEVRNIEIGQPKPAVEASEAEPEEIAEEEDVFGKSDKIYELIKKLDKGPGANTQEVIESYGEDDAEKLINSLLKEGDIFEVSPGKLKVLE